MESQIKNFSSFAFAISMLKHSFITMRRNREPGGLDGIIQEAIAYIVLI